MSEEASSILRGDQGECLGDRLVEGLLGASRDPTQMGLDLGDSRLDGRQVRRVGWQVNQETVTLLDDRAHLRIQVDTEIVHSDDLARSQGRAQDVAREDAEGDGVQGTHQRHRRLDASRAQSGDERRRGAVVARDAADRALALGSPSVRAGHRQRRGGLVDRDQVSRVEVQGEIELEGGTQVLVALGRRQRLFFRVNSSRRMTRPMVHWLMRTPWACPQAVACSASVASGVARTCAATAAKSSGPIRGTGPGTTLGWSKPVVGWAR